MKVILSEDVFDFSKGDGVLKLHKLFAYAYERRHAVICNPASAADAWFKTLDEPTRIAYQKALVWSAREAARFPANIATLWITKTPQPKWQDPVAVLPLKEALRVLDTPLAILLESSLNDWYFLQGIMPILQRDRVQRFEEEGWIIPLHGGGSEIKKFIDQRVKKNHEGLRTFALFDSDRRHPDELNPTWAPSSHHNGIEKCEGFLIEQIAKQVLPNRHWMLNRRSIESYMPRSQMAKASWGDSETKKTEKIAAFFRLSQQGRWYFPMKQGFNKNQHLNNAHRCRDLYTTVSQTDKQTLKRIRLS